MLALMRRKTVKEKLQAKNAVSHRIEIDAVKMMSDRSETKQNNTHRKWRTTKNYHEEKSNAEEENIHDPRHQHHTHTLFSSLRFLVREECRIDVNKEKLLFSTLPPA